MRILLLLLISACACEKVVEDKSATALEGRDLTLISSPCENVPGGGMDVCRFSEGSVVSSHWRVLVPKGSRIRGGQVIVQYKDFSKSFAIAEGSNEVVIPWADIVGVRGTTWTQDMAGIAALLAIVEYKDDAGVWKTSRARGEARILVLATDYAVLPMDSGVQAYSLNMNCKVQYATSGRSALKCVPIK